MFFGIILIVIGATLLLKALGLIAGFQWDIALAIVLLGIGVSMIWRRRG